MKLHHTRHHQAYVNGLNAAEKAYAESTSTRQQIALQSALKFNGGGGFILRALPSVCVRVETARLSGHINHSLFWTNLSPVNKDGGQLADGPLKKALERDFGSVEEFKQRFNATTAGIQGSGWGWLVSVVLHVVRERRALTCVV
jgi:Fe-Mn family superoxide dismutase